jgi:dolichol kinase
MASILAILFTHSFILLLAHPLSLINSSGFVYELFQRILTLSFGAIINTESLSTSAAHRFFHACAGLICGVSLIGLFWYCPFLLPYRKAIVNTDRTAAPIESTVANEVTLPLTNMQTDTLRRRKVDSVPTSPAAASNLPMQPFILPLSVVYACLLVVIFGVVWPFIWQLMGCEPFSFVLEYLVAAPIPVPGSLYSLLSSPPTVEYIRFQLTALQLNANIILSSPRFLILITWTILMLAGIFLFAPTGTAKPSEQRVHLNGAAVSPPARRWACFRGPVPNIIVRKYYHFLAVLLFVPAILLEPGLVALSYAVALALFILMEYIRLARMPPFGETMHEFMAAYLDVRDSGVVILTHTYLLIGCALPLWLHLPILAAHKPQILQSALTAQMDTLAKFHTSANQSSLIVCNLPLYIPALAGVLMLGIGDSMASLIGVWFGRHRWFGSSRSLEGTTAAIVSICMTVWTLAQSIHFINHFLLEDALLIIQPVRLENDALI